MKILIETLGRPEGEIISFDSNYVCEYVFCSWGHIKKYIGRFVDEQLLTLPTSRETSRARDASARRRSSSRNGSPDTRYILRPISNSISYDLKWVKFERVFNKIYWRNVLRMCEMKSELGYARAFVRLALERRLLHKHLQTIMTNHKLMMYACIWIIKSVCLSWILTLIIPVKITSRMHSSVKRRSENNF